MTAYRKRGKHKFIRGPFMIPGILAAKTDKGEYDV